MVWGDPCTEGSDPAKSCTDGQKPDKRHVWEDEHAHLCEVPKSLKAHTCRSGRDRMKDKALTWGGLVNHGLVKTRSQQRS